MARMGALTTLNNHRMKTILRNVLEAHYGSLNIRCSLYSLRVPIIGDIYANCPQKQSIVTTFIHIYSYSNTNQHFLSLSLQRIYDMILLFVLVFCHIHPSQKYLHCWLKALVHNPHDQ